MANSKTVLLTNVRLSYPNLYTKEVYEGEETKNWSATLLIPKDREEFVAELWSIAMANAEEALGKGKVPRKIKTSDRCCIRDGDMEEDENYSGMLSLKAMNSKRILTVDRAKNQVTAEDGDDDRNGIFYPGCFVDAQINFWTTAGYPEIRANLLLVRFRKAGDRIGGSGPSAVDLLDGLDDLENEDEADF